MEIVNEKLTVRRPLSFMSLPDEMLMEVIQSIDRKRDLLNLSLTCRKLDDLIVKRLYERVDIQIPQSKWMSWPPENKLPTFRSHIFESIQELSIRNGIMDTADAMYCRRRNQEGLVDDYICRLLGRIPPRQLRTFVFLHQRILNAAVLACIVSQQAKCLQDLRFFEMEVLDANFGALPMQLRVLHCRSMQSGESLARMLAACGDSLEVLHIGQEKELVDNYRRSRAGFLDSIAIPVEELITFTPVLQLSRLRELELVGVDARSFLPRSVETASFLWRLESLLLESCAGTAEFLDTLSAAFRYIQSSDAPASLRTTPVLRSFIFRHEAFTGAIKDSLIRFLTSFTGLTKLVLLFENATLTERPRALLANHGASLRSLVLESRLQPREHLGLDTSRPFGIGAGTNQLWQECIDDICNLCPNLFELGMAFPWDDDMVRLRKTKLPLLQHLRTIHIRNFPQSQVLSQLGDYCIQEHARRFIEWCFPSLVGSSRPGLETLAIGPTLYESRWKCSVVAPDSNQPANSYRRSFKPPEYLRSHYFCLDWAKTRFGRWNAMITPVSEKCMEELRDEQPLAGIFEHVWLR